LVTERHEEIAEFVRWSQTLGAVLVPWRTVPPPFREPYPTVEQIADELLEDSEFQALRLATWLRSPDGELIAKAVALVVPPANRSEFKLVVGALQFAADMQYQQGGARRAGAFALAVISIFGIAVFVPSVRRTAIPVPT
jgi:hypothetical protein